MPHMNYPTPPTPTMVETNHFQIVKELVHFGYSNHTRKHPFHFFLSHKRIYYFLLQNQNTLPGHEIDRNKYKNGIKVYIHL